MYQSMARAQADGPEGVGAQDGHPDAAHRDARGREHPQVVSVAAWLWAAPAVCVCVCVFGYRMLTGLGYEYELPWRRRRRGPEPPPSSWLSIDIRHPTTHPTGSVTRT